MGELQNILKKYNIKLKKSLGQNFLVDENIKRKIIKNSNASDTDIIIEVGAGIGTLTRELAQTAKKVIAIEFDRKLIAPLKENISNYNNVDIINSDILMLDTQKIIDDISKNSNKNCIKVVANLPYNIANPIIMKFLEGTKGIYELILMVQKEVAERITAVAGSKNYGVFSVIVQYYSDPQILFNVSPSCFFPKPEVYSSVIRLKVLNSPRVKVDDKNEFFKIVKASFIHRRKTIVNSIRASGLFDLSKEEIINILNIENIKETTRGETLSIEQFANISNRISKKV